MQAPPAPPKPAGVGAGVSHPFAMCSGKVLGLDLLACKIGIKLPAWRQKTGQMPFLCACTCVWACVCACVHVCVSVNPSSNLCDFMNLQSIVFGVSVWRSLVRSLRLLFQNRDSALGQLQSLCPVHGTRSLTLHAGAMPRRPGLGCLLGQMDGRGTQATVPRGLRAGMETGRVDQLPGAVWAPLPSTVCG